MMANDMVLEEKQPYTKNSSPPDYDGLWKKLIFELFEEFMDFFAQDIYNEIDFAKEPDFLQQEFHKHIIDKKEDRNYTDQLVKVLLKNGQKKWVLIHIEVQDKNSKDFTGRMFQYFYRIYEKHRTEIYAMALITTEDESPQPDHFHYTFYSTQLHYTYNTYKFRDHTIAELKKYDNPFAFAVIAAKYANRYKKDTEKRFYFKEKLVEQVFGHFHLSDQKARAYLFALLYFIDYLLKVPEHMQNELETRFAQHFGEEDTPMQAKNIEPPPILKAIFKRVEEDAVKQSTLKVAKKLIEKDCSDDFIMDATGLSQEEIKDLRESLDES